MPEAWTGNLIGKMHNKGITYDDLAEEMGVTKSYISMILNGKRKPPGIRGPDGHCGKYHRSAEKRHRCGRPSFRE